VMNFLLAPFSTRRPDKRPRMMLASRCIGSLVLALVTACCVLVAHGADYPTGIRVLWTAHLKTFTESGPSVADIDGDGLDEVVVAGREEIIVLEGDGREAWRWRTKGRFMTYPAVLERRGQRAFIYAADNTGLLTCLDGAGTKVWQAQLNRASSWSASVVCDLDSDGKCEVIQTDEKGTVWAFDAVTGKRRWQTSVDRLPVSPAVGDLDKDGNQEVVVVTGAGTVCALKADGSLLWNHEIGGRSETWATCAPVLFAAGDGSRRVVVASNEGRVVCLDGAGRRIWQRAVRGPVASGISVGDMDMNGETDVFVVTQLGVIYRFDENGGCVWEVDMQGRSLAAGAIIDINGDGSLEYALSTQRGRLLVLDSSARFVFDMQFDNRTINVTPAFGEIVPDSPGLEMAITGGESGRTFCLATNARSDGQSHWAAYRGNERKTGAWFHSTDKSDVQMAPENLSHDSLFTTSQIRFTIFSPDPAKDILDATASCMTPQDMRVVATSKVFGEHGTLLLPIKVLWPGTYRFAWSVRDANGTELFSRTREVELTPFANDRGLATRALAGLRSTASAVETILPASATALRQQAILLENELNSVISLQEKFAGGGASLEEEVLEKTAILVAHAGRAEDLAGVIKEAADLGPEASLVLFEGSLWENRAVTEQLPAGVEHPLALTRVMVPEEHEPVALGMLNILDRPLQARVDVTVPKRGPRITLHRSVETINALGEPSWDPLPELDESGIITIPPLSTAELWVDVHAAAVEPGEYVASIRVRALNGAGVLEGSRSPQSISPPESEAMLTLRVLPFAMAPAGDFRLCAWASLNDDAVADLLSHGNNVFIAPHGRPQYDEEGYLTDVDFAELDLFLEPLTGHDVVLLLSGIPLLQEGFGSPEYARRLRAYLDRLVDHLAQKGFDTNHFALYPIDEPGGHGWDAVNKVVQFGKMVREANAAIMLYVNGGGELPMFEALAPYTDIWCPGINMLPEDTPEMRVIRTSGKMLWSYDCAYAYARPVGPNIKNINIVGQFRTAALFALRHGATGIGFWSYNMGSDLWGRSQAEYPLVYPGRTKPVTSRRWEAVREGIEDYRLLAALRRASQSPNLKAAHADVQERIQKLLKESLPAMIDRGYAGVRLGSARYVLDTYNNDSTIRTFREEMMACVEALTNENGESD